MTRAIPYLFAVSAIVVSARFAQAQAGAPSDILDEVITDQHGNKITLTTSPHPISVSIPEGTPANPEGGTVVTVPPLTIDFHEPNNPTGQNISDRLHLDSYQVIIRSDDEPNGLTPRSGAVFIPVDARERFLPVSIFAHSDSEQVTPVTTESDHLHIVQGAFAGFPGKLFADISIAEPVPPPPDGEDSPPRVDFTIPATMYDVAEAGIPGTNPIISDYLDHGPITGYFISSDNQSLYDPALPVDGIVLEDGLFATDPNGPNPFYGGDLNFALRFGSDVEVPEPGSIVLLAVGLASVVAIGRKRFLRCAPPMSA